MLSGWDSRQSGLVPPPSSTFELAPGGAAILVKAPLTIAKLEVPDIRVWESMGRAVAGIITFRAKKWCCVTLYGFAKSHKDHGMNDALLLQTFLWAEKQTIPVMLGGDLNVTSDTSAIVSLSQVVKFWKLNDDTPTTRAERGGAAASAAIDHLFVSSSFLDWGVRASVSWDFWISDHFPIVAKWSIPADPPLVWKWPSFMRCKEIKNHPAWECYPTTYVEWSEYATRWLSVVFEECAESKTIVTAQPLQDKVVKRDSNYDNLRKAQQQVNRGLTLGAHACGAGL